MEKVFVYWDNSNIFIEAMRVAAIRNDAVDAGQRVRIDFDNMMQLVRVGRPVEKAVACGSIPPEMRYLWNRLEGIDIKVKLINRHGSQFGEQEMPDRILQLEMTKDCIVYNKDPGIVALLTGDGAGHHEGEGFHWILELLHKNGWKVELLSWEHSCNQRMREWVEKNGVFIALDDYYNAVTYLKPSEPGFEIAKPRSSAKLGISKRLLSLQDTPYSFPMNECSAASLEK